MSTSQVITHASVVLLGLFMTVVVLPVLHHHISIDYKTFRASSASGSPIGLLDYLQTVVLRKMRIRKPFSPPTPSPTLWLHRGYLEDMPSRKGPRPQVAGIKTQRQLNQHGLPHLHTSLSTHIRSFATTHSPITYLGRSNFESGPMDNTTLFSRRRSYERTQYFGEIVHVHPGEGSMHLNLHPADVAAVIERGWGERHPLAAQHSGWSFGVFSRKPAGYMMIYAPRDEKELQVCGEIVKAAIWWVGRIDSKSASESWS